jgi:hypothetical protein
VSWERFRRLDGALVQRAELLMKLIYNFTKSKKIVFETYIISSKSSIVDIAFDCSVFSKSSLKLKKFGLGDVHAKSSGAF